MGFVGNAGMQRHVSAGAQKQILGGFEKHL